MARKRRNEATRILEENLAREEDQKKRKAQQDEERAENSREAKRRRVERQEELQARFVKEGFFPVTRPLELSPEAQPLHFVRPDPSFIKRNHLANPVAIFFKLLPKEVWEHVAKETNAEMQRKKAMHEISKSTARKTFYPVTAREILQLFLLRQAFRERSGLRSLEQQFGELPSGLQRWPMRKDRFTAISSSLNANWPVLCELLRKRWAKCVLPGSEFAVDEAMFAFCSRTDPSSPQRFIPRKPHKNGLLGYLTAFKTSQGDPFVIDIEPDVQSEGSLNPRDALLALLARFPWPEVIPHVTIDAGFSSEHIFRVIEDRGGYFTASVNTQHKKWLYELLNGICPKDCWLAVRDGSGVIWSLKKGDEDRVMFLASNAFSSNEPMPVRRREPLFSDADVGFLSRVNKRALHAIATEMGLSLTDPTKRPEEVIVSHLEEKNEAEGRRRLDEHSQEEEQEGSEKSSSEDESFFQESSLEGSESEQNEIESEEGGIDEEEGVGSCRSDDGVSAAEAESPCSSLGEDSEGEERREATEGESSSGDLIFSSQERDETQARDAGRQRKGKGKGKEKVREETHEESRNEEEPGPSRRKRGGSNLNSSQRGEEDEKEKEELKKKKRPELLAMARRLGVSTVGKKEEIIASIIAGKKQSPKEIKRVMEKLSQAPQRGPAAHHSYYREHFNPIDLQDGHWYAIQAHHTCSSWKAKLVLSLLEVGLVNTLAIRKYNSHATMVNHVKEVVRGIFGQDFQFLF